jgi:hypothetical protein
MVGSTEALLPVLWGSNVGMLSYSCLPDAMVRFEFRGELDVCEEGKKGEPWFHSCNDTHIVTGCVVELPTKIAFEHLVDDTSSKNEESVKEKRRFIVRTQDPPS